MSYRRQHCKVIKCGNVTYAKTPLQAFCFKHTQQIVAEEFRKFDITVVLDRSSGRDIATGKTVEELRKIYRSG